MSSFPASPPSKEIRCQVVGVHSQSLTNGRLINLLRFARDRRVFCQQLINQELISNQGKNQQEEDRGNYTDWGQEISSVLLKASKLITYCLVIFPIPAFTENLLHRRSPRPCLRLCIIHDGKIDTFSFCPHSFVPSDIHNEFAYHQQCIDKVICPTDTGIRVEDGTGWENERRESWEENVQANYLPETLFPIKFKFFLLCCCPPPITELPWGTEQVYTFSSPNHSLCITTVGWPKKGRNGQR